MRALFKDIPLDKVSTSMTINAPASVLLAMYLAVAEEQGVSWDKVSGTIQNDILKEYMARGTYIFPPRQSLRLITDTIAFCAERVPNWNTISISGYHIREAGCTAAQEIAFTLGDGIAYVQAALDAGLKLEAFAPRLSFFFNAHNQFFEEVAKFRAARRLWARIMKERFKTHDAKSQMLRFHTQTAGSTLTAQQPDNNIVRTTVQAMAAVCGGTQSLHTNSRDEALALPTEQSARIALRTQQILAYESRIADVVDPFAGSYFVESLTDELESRASALLAKVDELGGMVGAIEKGFPQREIQNAAYAHQKAVEKGEQIVVGVNKFTVAGEAKPDLLRVDEALGAARRERIAAVRAGRDQAPVDGRLASIRAAAAGAENLMPRIVDAVKAEATVGEICDALRSAFGEYQERLVL
jgi:methylmalonyl-CoA mutase N-terminal domain/subunit